MINYRPRYTGEDNINGFWFDGEDWMLGFITDGNAGRYTFGMLHSTVTDYCPTKSTVWVESVDDNWVFNNNVNISCDI